LQDAVGHRPEFDQAGRVGLLGGRPERPGDGAGGEPPAVGADGDGLDGAVGAARRLEEDGIGQGRGIVAKEVAPLGPDDEMTAVGADGEALDHRAEGAGRVAENREAPGDQARGGGVGDVVDPEDAVAAPGDQAGPAREEGDRVQRPLGVDDRGDLATGGDVPDPDGPVDARRGEVAVGRREGQRRDRVHVPRPEDPVGPGGGKLADDLAGLLVVPARVAVQEDLAPVGDDAEAGRRHEPLAPVVGDVSQGERIDLPPIPPPNGRPEGPRWTLRVAAEVPGVDDLVHPAREQPRPVGGGED